MSSYASYCQDQATNCARRAKLMSSPEIVAYCRSLEFRWLMLAAQAQETGGALGHERGISAVRQARSIPGGIRKASRRIDRTKRALVAPDPKAKEVLR